MMIDHPVWPGCEKNCEKFFHLMNSMVSLDWLRINFIKMDGFHSWDQTNGTLFCGKRPSSIVCIYIYIDIYDYLWDFFVLLFPSSHEQTMNYMVPTTVWKMGNNNIIEHSGAFNDKPFKTTKKNSRCASPFKQALPKKTLLYLPSLAFRHLLWKLAELSNGLGVALQWW